MLNMQMELSLAKAKGGCASMRRTGRPSRARWWFAQMRQIVEHAVEWPAAEVQPGEDTGKNAVIGRLKDGR